MTNNLLRSAAAGAAIVAGMAFCLAASTAEAAKGVKKVGAAGGQHTITGEVTNVTQKNGTGSIHVRAARSHKKGAAAVAAGAKGKSQGQEFQVTKSTRFTGSGAMGKVGISSLHRGERVQVTANGQEAQTVHLMAHHNTTGRYHHHYMSGYRQHRSGHVQHHSASRGHHRRK